MGQRELAIVMPPFARRSERIEMTQRKHFAKILRTNTGILRWLEQAPKRMIQVDKWM